VMAWLYARRADDDRRVLAALRDPEPVSDYVVWDRTGLTRGRRRAALARLEAAELVTRGWTTPPSGATVPAAPPVRVYTLAMPGRPPTLPTTLERPRGGG
jgi:hypothetical protein